MEQVKLSDIYKKFYEKFGKIIPLSILTEERIPALKEMKGTRLDEQILGFPVGQYIGVDNPVGRFYLFLPAETTILVDIHPENLYIGAGLQVVFPAHHINPR